MRIIDFRLRPPLKGFLDMVMYADIKRTARMAAGIGMSLPPSVQQRSVDLMFREMDEAGIEIGVVPGRVSPVLGTIENDDVMSMVAQYPQRLIGFTSVNPVGGEIPIMLKSEYEISYDSVVARHIDRARRGRVLALRHVEKA